MTERDTFVTVADGDQLNQGYFNGIFALSKILLVYTGTAFNSSQTGSGTNSNSYETSLITAASLVGATYIRIKITTTASAKGIFSSTAGSAALKLEEKYNGGAYSTLFDVTRNSLDSDGSGGNFINVNSGTLEYIYTLTANDLANGIYLKITSTSVGDTNTSASLTNICTFIEMAI